MKYIFTFLIFLTIEGASQDLTTLILIRHAEKENTTDGNPGLSTKGMDRAENLVDLLSEIEIDAIYSTNYRRTLNTIDPISKSRDLRPIIYDPGNLKSVAERMMQQHRGQTILVCGHSNTTPTLANIFLGKEEFNQLDEKEYRWILILDLSDMGDGKAKVLINDLRK